jgi:hypothetical protein
MPLQEERNLQGMVFMLQKKCIIICNGELSMPLQEERNLLIVVFMLRVVLMLHQQTRVLLIQQLQNLPRKLNLRRHVGGRVEVCMLCDVVVFHPAVV